MRRLLPLLVAWLLVLAPAPAALADDPTTEPGFATEAVNLGAEPLVPYIVALLVTSAGLTIVGLVAIQVNRKPTEAARRRRRAAWWPCPACATSNAGDRDTCFACGAGRAP